MSLSERDAVLIAVNMRGVSREEPGFFKVEHDAMGRLLAAARAEGVADLLKDPKVVHINMLRGGIAKLSPAQIGHLYRGDEATEVIREVARQNPEAEGVAALQQVGEPVSNYPEIPDSSISAEPVAWRPIETAPKGPGRSNPINDFLPENLGPLLLMSIPFSPEPATTVGFWCPEHECWRHLADDGPHDIEPTHWKPFPLPQQTALVEGGAE